MMNLFLHLLAGHMVGDFALQTGTIARMKRESVRGLFLHVGIVTASTLLFTAFTPTALAAGLIVSFGHLLIDAVRTGPLRRMSCCPLTYFFLDQIAHMMLLILVARHFQPEIPFSALLHPHTTMDFYLLLLSTLIFLTFVVPIIEALLYEDLVRGESPVHLRVTNRLRLIGSVERIAGFLVSLSSWAYLAPLVFIPHYVYRFTKKSPEPFLYRFIRPTLNMICAVGTAWIIKRVTTGI